jgi:hypothetical protein
MREEREEGATENGRLGEQEREARTFDWRGSEALPFFVGETGLS